MGILEAGSPARISTRSAILRHEWRVLVEPTQDFVAAQIGHFEQHPREAGIARVLLEVPDLSRDEILRRLDKNAPLVAENR